MRGIGESIAVLHNRIVMILRIKFEDLNDE
jgi:hypothetical protein